CNAIGPIGTYDLRDGVAGHMLMFVAFHKCGIHVPTRLHKQSTQLWVQIRRKGWETRHGTGVGIRTHTVHHVPWRHVLILTGHRRLYAAEAHINRSRCDGDGQWHHSTGSVAGAG